MPKFHSLRTVYPPLVNDESRELSPALHTIVTEKAQNIFNQDIELTHTPVTPVSPSKQHFQTEPIGPMRAVDPSQFRITAPGNPALSAPYRGPQVKTEKALQSLPSTQALQGYPPQSLLTALQATLEPKTNRLPLLIPAEMKKIRRQLTTEVLSPATRRTISRFKMGIVLGAMTAFIFLTAFSFGPANQGKYVLPLLDNLIQQSQQQALNSVLSQKPAQPIVAAPGIPNIPRSDLVALAEQDAIKYGISPVYFVRQIYAESGFNPNAYSPAGAVGIAQFLPSTAASLGVNPYDPVSALDGAAKYMARLSNQYGGDYAKALGAYNAGSGTLQNAINQGGANWLSFMPRETQGYVHKIMG